MVAGGGGAGDCSPGGDEGGINGSSMDTTVYNHSSAIIQIAEGGTQTKGGNHGLFSGKPSAQKGRFGMAGIGSCGYDCDGAGSGGSGYYGGGGASGVGGGGGGSSYISGHEGCISINEEAETEEEIIPSDDSIHYSKLFFENTIILKGSDPMPSFQHDQVSSTTIGNTGDGHARITYLDPIILKNNQNIRFLTQIITFIFIISS